MLDKAKAIFKALSEAKSVSSVISGGLNDVRQEVERLKLAREDILDLPVTQDIAVERAVRSVQLQIADARQRVARPSSYTSSPQRWAESHKPIADFGAIALAYLGPQLIDAISADVRDTYDGAEGVSDKDRQKLLDDNEREILDAELAEEAIIRQAEHQGIMIERRIDADPRAILADESALP